MTLFEGILAAMLSLQAWSGDRTEPPESRQERLGLAARAVASAVERARCEGVWASPACRPVWGGDPLELAAAVVALGNHETHYAELVGAGRCEEMPEGQRCDHGRARTYWQAWASACPAAWAEEPGSRRELEAAAWCATRLMAGGARFCADRGAPPDWAGAFSRYAGHNACRTRSDRVTARVRTMRGAPVEAPRYT